MIDPFAKTDWRTAGIVSEFYKSHYPVSNANINTVATSLLSLTQATDEACCFFNQLQETASDIEIIFAISASYDRPVPDNELIEANKSFNNLRSALSCVPSLPSTARGVLKQQIKQGSDIHKIQSWAEQVIDSPDGNILYNDDSELYLAIVDIAYADNEIEAEGIIESLTK